jgi:hypothetical protein
LIAFVAFACLLAANACAETLLLRGTVGKYPVIMEVRIYGDELEGIYFYEKYKQDISISGNRERDDWRLKSDFHDEDDDNMEKFVLTRAGDVFTGTFTIGKSVALPVNLHVIPPGTYPDSPKSNFLLHWSGPDDGSDYLWFKMTGLEFFAGEKQVIGGKYQIQWLREPLSGFEMFHVIGGYPDTTMATINRRMDQDYYRHLALYFSCSAGDGSGVDSLAVSHYLVNQRFVSYSISSSWFCAGAAHPDFGTQGTTIEARTGKQLALEDIFWLGSGERLAENSDAWYKYRTEVFAPMLVDLFKQLYPQQMQRDDNDEDACDYSDTNAWDFPSWYMTDEGLHVGAYFYRAARVCDDPGWSIIPYRILKENNPALFE